MTRLRVDNSPFAPSPQLLVNSLPLSALIIRPLHRLRRKHDGV